MTDGATGGLDASGGFSGETACFESPDKRVRCAARTDGLFICPDESLLDTSLDRRYC